MKKNIISIIIILIIFLFLFLNTNLLSYSVNESILNFKNNLLPTLFPVFILSDLLINYNFEQVFSFINKPLKKLFKINDKLAFIYIISILTGYSNTFNIILNMYNNKSITTKEINRILKFCNFVNPLYLITIVSLVIDIKWAIIILIVNIISNSIIGILSRNINLSDNYYSKIKKENFFICFSNSIKKSINSLLIILGINIITTMLINTFLNNNSLITIFIKGLIDFTTGIPLCKNIPITLKIFYITIFISFGSINSLLQCMSIIPDINYKNYLLSRLLQIIISLFILIFVMLIY